MYTTIHRCGYILSTAILHASLFCSSMNAQTFTYDATGRVVNANYSDGTIIHYKYDAAGNLKKVKINPGATVSISAEKLSGNIVRYTVQRTSDLSQSLTVGLITSGDAVNGQDYSSFPASVTFPAHESSASFSVTMRPDRPASTGKKLVVSLADGDDYNLDKNSSATVTLPAKK